MSESKSSRIKCTQDAPLSKTHKEAFERIIKIIPIAVEAKATDVDSYLAKLRELVTNMNQSQGEAAKLKQLEADIKTAETHLEKCKSETSQLESKIKDSLLSSKLS